MQNSLRFRLTLILITLAIGPLLLVGVIIAQRTFTFERDQAYDLQNQVAQNVSSSVEAVFLGINNDLENLGNEIRSLETPDQPQQLSLMLSAISSGVFNDFYDELTLLDKNGQEIVRLSPSEIVPNTDLTNRSDQNEFKEPLASRSIYYSPISKDAKTGKAFMTIAIPLYIPRSTNLSGVLIARIRLDIIGNTIGRAQVGENQTVYLTDSNGNVLAHQDRTLNISGMQIQLPRSVTTQIGINNDNAILSPAKIQLGDQTLYIVAEKPAAIALQIAYTILTTIAVVSLLALAVAGALGYLAIRQIVVPIEGLASLAGRVAEGDLTQKASITHRDEIGILAKAFNSMTTQLLSLIGSLEQRVEERTSELEERANQLEAISSVARSTASIQNLEELLPSITRLVSERFDYYHAGIFLLDKEKEFAILRAANSEGGKRMLERQHKLKLDSQSIVGFVTSRGEPRIALDVGADAVFFNNPDLPDTRSEMALPLRVGGNVIGALDVQSRQPNAFTEEDVSILSTLADQVAIAIENARLFSNAREALKLSEETFKQYVTREWSSFTRGIRTLGYRFDGVHTRPIDTKNIGAKTNGAQQTGNTPYNTDASEISIPIRLRGKIIGMFDVKSKRRNRKWTPDDIALLEAAAERTAIALENARLVESSQMRASREHTIGEISTRIGTANDMDAIMQTVVEELGRKIGSAMEVTFELDTEAKGRQS